MKKIKFNEKLSLNKSTVSQLNNAQQGAVIGGKVHAKTHTGPDRCTAMVTFACCNDEKTATGPGVCTALPTNQCCTDWTKDKHCK